MRLAAWLAAALALACSGRGGERPAPDTGPARYVECTEPRPQVCTREWRPVCARRDTGIRCVTTPCPSWEAKVYGNACSACADPAVHGFRPGECASEGAWQDG